MWHSRYPALEDCLQGLKRHRQEMEVIARSQMEASGATKGFFETGKMKPMCHCTGSRINQAGEPALQQLARVNIPRPGEDITVVTQLCPQSMCEDRHWVFQTEALSRGRHWKLQTENDRILVWSTGLSLLLMPNN